MVYPDKQELKKNYKKGIATVVYKKIIADTLTPVRVYSVFQDQGNSFLLESASQGALVGRYSFIGVNPKKTVNYDLKNDGDIFKTLKKYVKGKKIHIAPELPKFCGGAVGFLGYDTVSLAEDIKFKNKDSLKIPDASFLITNSLLIFDHLKKNLIITNILFPGKNFESDYKKCAEAIDSVRNKISNISSLDLLDAIEPSDDEIKLKPNMTKKEFVQKVKKIKKYIKAGDIFQCVLSLRLEIKLDIKPFNIYRALRAINPSPYMFYLNFNDYVLIGASPETMVEFTNGKVKLKPIAGTRPVGKTYSENEELKKDLLNDEKEIAEHIMLVDLGRNDAGRVSKAGSVHLTKKMKIEEFSHVMHIVSEVEGEAQKNKDFEDIIKASFPAGTVTGAPKIRAMEIIEELEKEKRSFYAGAAGYVSYTGDCDLAISIRTLLYKKGRIILQAGAGIVMDSVPEKEYDECLHKARGLIKALAFARKRSLK